MELRRERTRNEKETRERLGLDVFFFILDLLHSPLSLSHPHPHSAPPPPLSLFTHTQGTYAKVKYGRHAETGEEVAVKIMRKDRVLGPEATSSTTLPRELLLTFCKVLSPYASHLAEELWERLGGQGCVCQQPWPMHDEALTVDDTVTLGVQINGKRRDEITVARDASDADVQQIALASAAVQKFMEGKPARKVIVVKGRLVNIVL